MICYPNAKINLGLNVTERRADGYHNLETVFYPIPVCDILKIETQEENRTEPADHIFPEDCSVRTYRTTDYTLHTGGITIDCPPEKNLLIKALRALQRDFSLPHLHIYMYKQITSGAGLGGGSSDAAYMMTCLNRKFSLGLTDDELEHRVSTLGADCAFFIRNRPVFATGIGNILTPSNLSLSGWHLALAKPDIFVSTKEAYAQIRPRHPHISVTDILRHPVEEWKDILTNDFEEGIFAFHPEIADIKKRMYDCGAAYASMSGSGSSVFGLFRNEPDKEAMRKLFSGCFYYQGTI